MYWKICEPTKASINNAREKATRVFCMRREKGIKWMQIIQIAYLFVPLFTFEPNTHQPYTRHSAIHDRVGGRGEWSAHEVIWAILPTILNTTINKIHHFFSPASSRSAFRRQRLETVRSLLLRRLSHFYPFNFVSSFAERMTYVFRVANLCIRVYILWMPKCTAHRMHTGSSRARQSQTVCETSRTTHPFSQCECYWFSNAHTGNWGSCVTSRGACHSFYFKNW